MVRQLTAMGSLVFDGTGQIAERSRAVVRASTRPTIQRNQGTEFLVGLLSELRLSKATLGKVEMESNMELLQSP